jgi:hypothetical protein
MVTAGCNETNLRLTSRGEREDPGGVAVPGREELGGVPGRGLPAKGPAVPEAGVPGEPDPLPLADPGESEHQTPTSCHCSPDYPPLQTHGSQRPSTANALSRNNDLKGSQRARARARA